MSLLEPPNSPWEKEKKKRKDPTKEGKYFELGINFALAKIKK